MPAPNVHLDAATFGRMFGSIRQQVDDHLLETAWIAIDPERAVGLTKVMLNMIQSRQARLYGLLNDQTQIDLLSRQLDLSHSKAGNVH